MWTEKVTVYVYRKIHTKSATVSKTVLYLSTVSNCFKVCQLLITQLFITFVTHKLVYTLNIPITQINKRFTI